MPHLCISRHYKNYSLTIIIATMKLRHIRVHSQNTILPNKQNANSLQNPATLPSIASQILKKQKLKEHDMQASLQVQTHRDQSSYMNYSKNIKPQRRKKTFLQLHSRKVSALFKEKQSVYPIFTSRPSASLNRLSINSIEAPSKTGRDRTQATQKSQSISRDATTELTSVSILKKHKITEKMRAKMLDWIIQVLSAYSYGDDTFFLTVQIMDRFFHKYEKSIQSDELHSIGVAAIYIAAKFEEVAPLRLKTIYEQVAHKKIPKVKILQREAEIVKTLDFVLIKQGLFYFYQSQITSLLGGQLLKEQEKKQICQNCVYFLKGTIFDPEYYFSQCPKKLAKATIYAALKLTSLSSLQLHLQKELLKSQPIEAGIQIASLSDQIIQKVFELQKKYPEYKNLEKNNPSNFQLKNAKQRLDS